MSEQTVAQRPAVLIVDDREDNLLVLQNLLASFAVELVSVTSGNAALSATLTTDFALIILDVQMPEMDGFEVAELLRGSKRTRHIPIIFVTAISREDHHVARGYEVGAIDYIFKPFDPHILCSKVRIFLELDARRRQAEEHSQRLQEHVDALSAAEAKLQSQAAELVETNDELQRYMRELEETENRFHNMISSSSVGMIAVDGDGIVRFVNAAAEQITRQEAEQLIGQPLGTATLADGAVMETEFGDDSGLRTLAECQVMGTVWEGEPGFVISLTDITERRHRDEQGRQMFYRETVAMLAADIGERLRARLQQIAAAVHMPAPVPLAEIAAQARAGLLLTEQLTATSGRPDRDLVDLAHVARELLPSLQLLFNDRNITLAAAEAAVHGDTTRLQQLLLSMALSVNNADDPGDLVVECGEVGEDAHATPFYAVRLAAFDGEWTQCPTSYVRSRHQTYLIRQISGSMGGVFQVDADLRGAASRVIFPAARRASSTEQLKLLGPTRRMDLKTTDTWMFMTRDQLGLDTPEAPAAEDP
jgi:PAS domain S-box-containing protein